MLNQIHISYPKISNTIYIIARDMDGKVWNTSTGALETWDDSNIENYDIPSTYKGGNIYIAYFPLTAPRGYYTIQIVIQYGPSPTLVDLSLLLDSALGYWDADAKNLLPVRVDTLVEYDNGEKFTEKALEDADVTAVSVDHYTEKTVIEEKSCYDQPLSEEGSYETG